MAHRALTLMLAGLAMLGPLAIGTYLPSFPAIARQFSVSLDAVQLTLSVYLFAFALMALFYGTLSDSFGRRPVILGALLIFAGASTGASLSPSFSWLLACRGIQGASAGAGIVIGQAIVRDQLAGVAAQRVIANILMVFSLAPAIAPVVGGFLHVSLGWRSVFAFMSLSAMLLWFACLFWLKESLPRPARYPFHLLSIVRNYGSAIRHPKFLLRSLAIGFYFGGFALYVSSAANFVMKVLHLSETEFAWLFVPMIVGLVLGFGANGRMANRAPPAVLVGFGFAFAGCAAVSNLVYTLYLVPVVPWAVLPIMLYTFGLALALPSMTMMTLDLFPHAKGLASSLQKFVQMAIFALVAGFIAPLLFGSALKLAGGLAMAVTLGLLFWLLAGVQGKGKYWQQQLC